MTCFTTDSHYLITLFIFISFFVLYCGLSEQRQSNLVSIFGLAESERLFVKCREEFRQSVKYPGAIYSDFPPVENSLPYFHISDEYRMFNPEGMCHML